MQIAKFPFVKIGKGSLGEIYRPYGSETVYLCKSLEIKIGNYQKKVPVGFLERDDIPALLGRLGIIEALRVIFEKFATTFERPKR